MQTALAKSGLLEISENRILHAASLPRIIIPRIKRYSPELIQAGGVYSAERLAAYLQGTEMVEDSRLSERQKEVIARAIAEYYLEVLTAGAKCWPWRWKLS